VSGAVIDLAAVLYAAPIAGIFRFEALVARDLVIALLAGAGGVIVVEAIRLAGQSADAVCTAVKMPGDVAAEFFCKYLYLFNFSILGRCCPSTSNWRFLKSVERQA
jgi:hypothetical protein